MNFIIKYILKFLDSFTEKQITNYLKIIFGSKIPLIIDVGSHKGEYINNLIKNFKFKKIYAFEPSPKNFDQLKKIFQDKDNIELLNVGIGEKNEKRILNQNIESSSSSINQLNKDSKYFKKKYLFLNLFQKKEISYPINIKLINLSNFINQKKINHIDLLKIDTEGYEFSVLKGLRDEIKKIKAIHLEHHFDDMIIKNYKLSDIHNYLIKYDFKKKFKIKMKLRKSFEYIYENQLM